MLHQVCQGLAFLAAVGAAGLWDLVATRNVKTGSPMSEGSGVDLISTMRRQSYWNKWAAVATAISVVLQGVAPYL